MIYPGPNSDYVKLDEDDPLFNFHCGIVRYSRSAIEISDDCPRQFKELMMRAVIDGWVKPVAYMPQREYTWTRLETEDAG